ncbi:MAG: UDP-3-O-(3-hydroxymyristoyl)glucosamine N-acyltransferase, partial [Pseudomonadota bacterium]
VGGSLEGPPEREVSGLKGIEEAGPQDVAFLANPRYAKALPSCKAGVVLVSRDQKVPEGLAVIRVDDPYLAYAKVLTAASKRPYEAGGVHSRAFVDESAELSPDVTVHALAYVGPGAKLGARVVLHSGVHVGAGAEVGDDTVLHPNVTLYHGCKVGRRCIIHGGSVIGADGYGFVPQGEGYFKIPQLGIVQIDDDVEIGALCTIDRAAMGRTWIKSGVKTDNMVHIAHNCVVGENTLLVAQVGISGSTKLGKHVVLGGQVGVAGHIEIGDNVQAAGKTGITKSVPAGEVLGGFPAVPHKLWLRTSGLIKRLPEVFDRLKALEKKQDQKAGGSQED